MIDLKINLIKLTLLGYLLTLSYSRNQWTADQANEWYKNHGWQAGCNYIPNTAVNVLEMWQESTFDPTTIDKELGWAQSIGFKTIRVFLHHLVYFQNIEGFKARLNRFLTIAASHKIKTIFVLFDDCWNPEGVLGKQPAPIPSIHNSRWVQAPGQAEFANQKLFDNFKKYVTDIIFTHAKDERILFWDLYNEPGNSGHEDRTMPLLKETFNWARSADPRQPITAGTWNWNLHNLNKFQLDNSDIITFHVYANLADSRNKALEHKQYGRPAICTEYMARELDSKFITHLPMFKEVDIPAINWGLVDGKTQTIYPWWSKEGDPRPAIWFHEIFNQDGTPFDQKEIDVIKQQCLKKEDDILTQ